ncbi:hypothetical protein DFH06DRAFT_1326395 [Mycena polygramma]|nr:hypothetical protein DFH06DRAFT_1326395 [Mycena polygramma]
MPNPSNPTVVIDRTFILTWGFEFIAYTLDTVLWGVAMVLVLQYFRSCARRDPVGIQVVVGTLGLLTTNHFIFYAIENFKNFVSMYGNLEAENECRAKTPFFSKLQALTGPISSTQSAAALACDIMITGILCTILRKSRTGIRRTDSVVDKMIIYALNRGVMTSLWALLQLIFFIGMPGTFVFEMFIVPSCHLYVISVCGMLISRESLRAQLNPSDGIMSSFPMSSMEPNFRHEAAQPAGQAYCAS